VGGEPAADDPLAAPVAVDVGGVDERDAGVDGSVDDRHGVGLRDLAPVGAELPGPEADDGHGPVCEAALLHGTDPKPLVDGTARAARGPVLA